MDSLDTAEQWQQLTERYRQMTNDELLALAEDSSELTVVAQQALSQELRQRGLEIPPPKPAVPPMPEPAPDSAYAEDRELVDLCTVWSLADARQLQHLLDEAGIPLFMGPEKATNADAVTSNFAVGVNVQVMRIGLPWANQLLKFYQPADEPELPENKDPEPLAICCPKCRSEDVIFGDETTEPEEVSKPRSKFDWTCGACGHQWEDDGVAKEA
jgi:hypothetical protein